MAEITSTLVEVGGLDVTIDHDATAVIVRSAVLDERLTPRESKQIRKALKKAEKAVLATNGEG